MGYEYSVKLENADYPQVIKSLANSFQSFSNLYRVESDDKGFALLCDDDKWAEKMQIMIDTADDNDTLPLIKGEQFLYCVCYFDGNERKKMIDRIETILQKLGYSYLIDDL